jgi:hypothetical protein
MLKKNSIRIENLEAQVGEKIFGFVDVQDSLGTISQLPVGIVNGTEEGPTLLITAGVHACEYPGIEGVIRVYRETKPKGLKGILIAITCMNLSALRMRTPYFVPFDSKDLNRSFPGSATGSPAEVIAHVVMKEFLPKVDYLVDCHGGDIGEKLFPMTIYNKTDDERISEECKELANAFGLDYCWCSDVRSEDDDKFISKANKAGVPSILAEAGSDGRYEEIDIETHVRGVKNVMKYLGMILGEIERESDKPRTTYYESIIAIKSGATGIFNSLVEPREKISRGQIAAEIKNLKGDVIEQVRSEEEGLLLMTYTKRIVNSGDKLFLLFKTGK